MTEREWLGSGDAEKMLDHLTRGCELQQLHDLPHVSERKLRLFACACCRQVWRRLPTPCREAVEATEKFAEERYRTADDEITSVETEYQQSRRACAGLGSHNYVWNATVPHAQSAASNAIVNARLVGLAPDFLVNLLRGIIGNPFRPVVIRASDPGGAGGRCIWLEPEHRTGDVMGVAAAAYEERSGREDGSLDAVRLAILADALEEGGCTEQAILGHLRSPGVHVRGDWALDLVLGKE